MKRLKLWFVENIDVATHLSHCIYQIEKLRLRICAITEEGFAALVDQIGQLAKPVKHCVVLYLINCNWKSRRSVKYITVETVAETYFAQSFTLM